MAIRSLLRRNFIDRIKSPAFIQARFKVSILMTKLLYEAQYYRRRPRDARRQKEIPRLHRAVYTIGSGQWGGRYKRMMWHELTAPSCRNANKLIYQGVCVFSSHSFWTSSSLDVPAWVTQEGHTGFFIHFFSAVRALIFLARRIQPFLSLVDFFCVLTI